MKKEYVIILFVLIEFIILLSFYSLGLNKKHIDPEKRETIVLNIPQKELGSTIIMGSDCIDYAKEYWKNFTFTINDQTNCELSYIKFTRNSPVEIHCTCYKYL